ncbi:DNA oxidative demethylase AlkB [Paracoccus sp. MBLB3053]|uniref:DNA oxidative demethylase AlkB n=1 Tax=Paracoccus aurantius TaxID=3073814 RepID=A0ABU2HUD8_9RHOB|nr:DNA oxidative demethylase AlkB [Paracoccus sp. MBLB3053]MDS9467899.1 DNA oxidative demethylase AlkB [Paracoccus sp. MBLB3053]
MESDLFGDRRDEIIAPGAMILRGIGADRDLLAGLASVEARAPFRRMMTPGGRQIGVEMTNCGMLGWVSDRRGYRYETHDPESGRPWPDMPPCFVELAHEAALIAGFEAFEPDACLINRYAPGVKMGLHQDRDEAGFDAPIVSVSLGLPATFQFGGTDRKDPVRRHELHHGDVAVWGGPSRLAWHGILTLKPGEHPETGRCRINLTFRQAGQR